MLIHILLIAIDFTLTGAHFAWYKCCPTTL